MASRHDGTDLRSSKAAALTELLELVPFLYHRLRAASQSLHGEGEFSGARSRSSPMAERCRRWRASVLSCGR